MRIHVFDRLYFRFDVSLYCEFDRRGQPVLLWSDLQKVLKKHHASRSCLCFDREFKILECPDGYRVKLGFGGAARVVDAFGGNTLGFIFSDIMKAPKWFGNSC